MGGATGFSSLTTVPHHDWPLSHTAGMGQNKGGVGVAGMWPGIEPNSEYLAETWTKETETIIKQKIKIEVG